MCFVFGFNYVVPGFAEGIVFLVADVASLVGCVDDVVFLAEVEGGVLVFLVLFGDFVLELGEFLLVGAYGFEDVSGLFGSFVGVFDVVAAADFLAELAEVFFAVGEGGDFVLEVGDYSFGVAGVVLESGEFVAVVCVAGFEFC